MWLKSMAATKEGTEKSSRSPAEARRELQVQTERIHSTRGPGATCLAVPRHQDFL